jgi:RsiW-degrading membrane proteinase PrsW (M82 family)
MRDKKDVGPGKFSWRELFSEVFRKHTEEELEQHWTAGTIGNIPTITGIDADWPKPWLFVRVFGLSLLVYLILLFGWIRFLNVNLLPGLLVLGTVAIPLSVLIFFFEMNARRNISMFLLTKMMFLGGVVSLVFSLFMFLVAEWAGLSWLGASVAGIAEEIGKLCAVLVVANSLRYPYILNGLLFGAAVGTGFAVFESAGYALTGMLSETVNHFSSNSAGNAPLLLKISDSMFEVVNQRGIFSPFGHVIWTAMTAGALWMVKGARKFEFNMLADFRFLRVFIAAMLLHGLWNAPWQVAIVTAWDKYLLLGVIGWGIVFYLIRCGLQQLAEEQARNGETPEQEPGVSEVIRIQSVYAGELRKASCPAPAAPERFGYDHLNIAAKTRESKAREHTRERPDFSKRAWKKYYSRDKRGEGGGND